MLAIVMLLPCTNSAVCTSMLRLKTAQASSLGCLLPRPMAAGLVVYISMYKLPVSTRCHAMLAIVVLLPRPISAVCTLMFRLKTAQASSLECVLPCSKAARLVVYISICRVLSVSKLAMYRLMSLKMKAQASALSKQPAYAGGTSSACLSACLFMTPACRQTPKTQTWTFLRHKWKSTLKQTGSK